MLRYIYIVECKIYVLYNYYMYYIIIIYIIIIIIIILETSTGPFYIKIMRFAGFLHVQIQILEMQTFREPCNSFHQGKKQLDIRSRPDIRLLLVLQSSRNVGIPRMDLDMEKICETHNLYIIIIIINVMLLLVGVY